MRKIFRSCLLAIAAIGWNATAAADRVETGAVDALRTTYPAGSIDSAARADAALASTAGAKAQVEKEYKASARDCLQTVLVNNCVDRARAIQRKRLTDIDAVELEANRYKRRDHADRLEAERAQREGERQAKAPADAVQRERNRKSFVERQSQTARDTADHERAQARRSGSRPHHPVVKVPQTSAEKNAAQRAKNVLDYDAKVRQADEHRAVIARRTASKDADRKRRADAKAARDAEAAARAAKAAAPPALPPPSGTKR